MLYVVGTPIGNLEDLSPRALRILRVCDVIACEDTRRTRQLLSRFNVPRPGVLLSYREGNEDRVGEQIAGMLDAGRSVALCTDGGMPGISDPGYRLVRLAVERGLAFEVVPGPSAVSMALLASGLPTSSYTFKGFPPRKRGQMLRFFAEEADRPHTLVVFESPVRIGKTLDVAREAFGDRQAAVCIELTKAFERVERGFLSELAATFAETRVKGEVTLVFAGNNPKFARLQG
jgi:16S rRNA (cytidine1402-2'-O)-methyltransferase